MDRFKITDSRTKSSNFSVKQKKKLWNRASENYFVSERNEIAKGIDGFLAQPEVGRASTVTLIDLVHVQFVNFGCNEKQREKLKSSYWEKSNQKL